MTLRATGTPSPAKTTPVKVDGVSRTASVSFAIGTSCGSITKVSETRAASIVAIALVPVALILPSPLIGVDVTSSVRPYSSSLVSPSHVASSSARDVTDCATSSARPL